jgi:hypothetical protein
LEQLHILVEMAVLERLLVVAVAEQPEGLAQAETEGLALVKIMALAVVADQMAVEMEQMVKDQQVEMVDLALLERLAELAELMALLAQMDQMGLAVAVEEIQEMEEADHHI